MASEFIKRVYITFISFNLLFNTTCDVSETLSDFCPDQWEVSPVVQIEFYKHFTGVGLYVGFIKHGEGKAHHGEWSLNFKDGYRCILKCHHGYRPSGCNVLRKNEQKEWNHDVTTCQEDSWILSRKAACIAAVRAVIVTSPLLLKALGFSAAGIAAGSLAAKYMSWAGPFPKGSLFADLQGISLEQFSLLISPIKKICEGVIYLSSTDCEEE